MKLVQAKCPSCGAEVQTDSDLEAAVCPYCGSAYIVERAIQNYSKTTVNSTEYVNHYGNESNVTAQTVINHYYYGPAPEKNRVGNNPRNRKSKWTALLLCVFLGFLGIHRFYLGRYKTGILWMFTGGLLYIGWITDIFKILFGHLTDARGGELRPFSDTVLW